MSSLEESTELKRGDPIAVKAGGMRITKHKPTRDEKPLTNEPKKDENDNEKIDADEEYDETEVVETAPKQNLITSGAVARSHKLKCDAKDINKEREKKKHVREKREKLEMERSEREWEREMKKFEKEMQRKNRLFF